MNSGSPLSPAWPEGAWLDVGDGHRVWWCEGGDPAGAPVVIVHGGPGGASRIETTRWFDGLPVRWIVFDQRGCGRSTPLGSTAANDLAALVADAERLRERLGIDRWALVGGSWGARVALAYAAAHGARTAGLFLRSPFLGSPAETRRYVAHWDRWLGEAGRAWLGPALVAAFRELFQLETAATPALAPGLGKDAALAPGLGKDAALAPGLSKDAALAPGLSKDAALAPRLSEDAALARAWSAYDDAQSLPGGVALSGVRWALERLPQAGAELRASWRVHAHYAAQRWGGTRGAGDAGHAWSLDAVAPSRLAALGPLAIVWGAADATCDPLAAAALAQRWPAARAVEVAGAGHRMADPRLRPVLIDEARRWAAALGGRRAPTA